MPDKITILLAEAPYTIPAGTSLYALREQINPQADVLVYNGAPAQQDVTLGDGDSVVLIERGVTPPKETLEALMAARHTPGVHRRLKQSVVGIAGVGGLGTAVAVALARIGVGKLILVDFDVVEPSNLNRQQFFVDQIGQPKVAAMQANLARINPYVQVETHNLRLTPENIPEIYGEVDVLVEAFDAADQKAMLMTCVVSHMPQTPLVMATGLAGHMPSNTVVTRKQGKNVVLVGDLTTAAAPGTGLMAPRVGVAAHHQANAALRILLGEDPVG